MLDSGKQAVVPGNPQQSELVRRIISDNPDVLMPPPSSHKRLSPEQVQVLQDWNSHGRITKWERVPEDSGY